MTARQFKIALDTQRETEMKPTFYNLNREIETQTFISGSTIDLVHDLLDRARGNADDTVYAEKNAPEKDWDKIALGSVLDLLSSGREPKTVVAWFAKRGVVA